MKSWGKEKSVENRDILSMTIGNVHGTWVHSDQAYNNFNLFTLF